jgi:hypothetical protein
MKQDQINENPSKLLLRPHAVTERYSVTIPWLNDSRHKGYGPKFLKVGQKVFYPLKETDDWFFSHGLVQSTSEVHHES